MEEIGLEAFLERLPEHRGPNWNENVLEPAFTARVPAPMAYVWPSVAVDGEVSDSPITLVTAPGAMGKSIGARAVAARLNAPHIDLARVAIGGDGLTGMLTRVLGWDQAPDFVKKLRKGETALVLDSLDEAQLAAGRQHFEAFLRNISQLVGGGAGKGQVLIFGRRDALDSAAVEFEILETPAGRISIEPLDYSRSCHLIDLVLDDVQRGGKKYELHRTHSEPFGKFRDAVLQDLARALGTPDGDLTLAWESHGEFLGYPPVLMVLGRHMEVDNPGASTESIVSLGSSRSRGELLQEITEEIMDRESSKVREQMCQVLGIAPEDPRAQLLYSREEQIIRVVGFLQRRPLAVAVPGSLTPEEAAVYQEQIESFVPDHPFLRGQDVANAVFGDYVSAYATLSESLPVQGLTPLNGRGPGPFFAHFVHAMAPKAPGQEFSGTTMAPRAIVPERIVDQILKSFALGSFHDHSFVYSHREKDSHAGLVMSDDLDSAIDDPNLSMLDFLVNECSGVLELASPLGRGIVVTDGTVLLSSPSGEFQLGPDLAIYCTDLVIDGSHFSAVRGPTRRTTPHGGVLMIARGSVEHAHDLRVSAHPPESLVAIWSDMWHQWQPYKLDNQLGEILDVPSDLAWQITVGARRILKGFHASAGGDPSLYYERFERFVVGTNHVFNAVLRGLLELDVIAREGNLYRLKLGKLSEHGVSWAGLSRDDFAEMMRPLLRTLMGTSAVSEVIREAQGQA